MGNKIDFLKESMVLLLFVIFVTNSLSVQAQTALIQGAYRQLQLLAAPDSSIKLQTEEQKLFSLDALKEDTYQLQSQLDVLKQEQQNADKNVSIDVKKLKLNEVKKLTESSKKEQEGWKLKKSLSENASIQLNHERVSAQHQLNKVSSRHADTDNADINDIPMLEQKLFNLSLKIRFSERYQALSENHISRLEDLIDRLEKRLLNEFSDNKDSVTLLESTGDQDDLFSVPHAHVLRTRLDQTRKDLIQLQNLHYSVKYQLTENKTVESLYQIMIRQKQRLQTVPAALNARTLHQELNLKRFLLLEESIALSLLSDRKIRYQKTIDTLELVDTLIQLVTELQVLETELFKLQQQMLQLLNQRQIWLRTTPVLEFSSWMLIMGTIEAHTQTFLVWLRSHWLSICLSLVICFPMLVFYRWQGVVLRKELDEMRSSAEIENKKWGRLLLLQLMRPLSLLFLPGLAFYLTIRSIELSTLFTGYLLMTYVWFILLDGVKSDGLAQTFLGANKLQFPISKSLALSSLLGLWVVGFSWHWSENPFDNRLAQVVLILVSGWQWAICWRWKNSCDKRNWQSVALRIFTFSMLASIITSSVIGYTPLAWLVFSHVQVLILSGALLAFLYTLIKQGFNYRARRLAFQKAMELRKEDAEHFSTDYSLKLSKKLVCEMEVQSQVILSLLFTLLTVVLLSLIWINLSPLLAPALELSLFKGQNLLTTVIGGGVTLIIILIITAVMGKNLPGLLQMLLPLQFIKQPGNAYIINRLLVYLVWAAGITTAFSQLGLPWEKIQWIIIAVSVGVGLGLQDIVANFFSGLIILIERPFRVGDTITVNEIHGTVRKISVRATIIEDFDRKELIIPNKTLITGQVTNWSLSSDILRIKLWYGVDHGTDNELVSELLYRAANESSKVLCEPLPEVYFIAYTENAERYELRIFVAQVDDRFPAMNQVNTLVKKLFQENSIKVAHLQHDVHLPTRSEVVTKSSDLLKNE